ncbi:hypothetical protein QR680_001195 [Steinernema hermaphroditum]|uniref:Uncharacterized protein n=1 Tax=Steinernema hermaphroditum TaxID=289476 RepID=A0AA39GXE9_9BILA|nr:hypothetical protein QR680_001195 [Steinernema hermaphroditum]
MRRAAAYIFTTVVLISCIDRNEANIRLKRLCRVKRNGFTNNYGYGPFGVGPANGGFDSFGFYKDKFYNSGLPAKYTFSSYRNYYEEYHQHKDRNRFKNFYEEFSQYKNRETRPVAGKFEILQQERFGPYYNGVWGNIDHSPYWFG